MPRPLRIQFKNAWYHVMNRGAGRGKIFKNATQRLMFLELLNECNQMFNLEIHAYCLMDNHYHLLLSTPNANLSRVMRHLNGIYTQRYNRMMSTDGPLFRGRYKAQLIDEDNYLLIVSRYIHLNPVVAGLVKRPVDFKWSSYSAYLDEKTKPKWLSTNVVQSMLANASLLSHVHHYQGYVEFHSMDEINVFASTKIADPILGAGKFKENLLSQIDSQTAHACAADIERAKAIPSIKLILEKVCEFYEIEQTRLIVTKRGSLNWPKLVFVYISRCLFGYSIKGISELLGCSYRSATISTAIYRCKEMLSSQQNLEQEVQSIYQLIRHTAIK